MTEQAKSVEKQKASVKEASDTELQSPLAEGWKCTVPPTGCDYGSLKPVTQLRFRWGEAVTSQAWQVSLSEVCFVTLHASDGCVQLSSRKTLDLRLEFSKGLINRLSHKSESLGTTCHDRKVGDIHVKQLWGEEVPDIKEMKRSGNRN